VLLTHGKSPPYCGTKKKLKYLHQKSPTDLENGVNENFTLATLLTIVGV
jgi:hypothetical protein